MRLRGRGPRYARMSSIGAAPRDVLGSGTGDIFRGTRVVEGALHAPSASVWIHQWNRKNVPVCHGKSTPLSAH